ncbi:MAG TPA: MATE family efflux transporter [Thermoanaerobaculia bacterium]|nr:MATE family efflux transporter [Thermoanaerobaculia bacterium]
MTTKPLLPREPDRAALPPAAASPAAPPPRRRAARLTEGPVVGHLARMTAPMLGGIAATMAFNLVDTYFVGRLGAVPLAAIGFSFPVAMVLVSVAIGLGAGTSSVLARAIGGEDERTIRRLATDSLVLSTLVSLAFSALGVLTIDPLFRALGASEEVLPRIREFMTIWYAGLVFLILPMVGTSIIRATGDTKAPGLIMIAGSVINLALDPILIFGLLGSPRLELRGAAIATVTARALTLVATLWVLARCERILTAERPPFAELARSWRRILHVGAPAAATNMIIPMALTLITPLVAAFGQEIVAGYGAASRVESMALILFYALSSIIGPFVGQNAGARRWDRVKEAHRKIALFSIAFGAALAVLLALFRHPIAGLFSDDPRVVEAAARYLAILPWSYGAYGIVMIVNASFNGLGQPFKSVAISVLRMIVLFLPLAWIGSRLLGYPGVFAGAAIANVAAGAFAWWWCEHTGRAQRQPA